MFVIQRRTEPPAKLWAPFVVAGLLATVTVGALSGAIDLWALRVHLAGVPTDHARGHGLAQVFGFLLLFTMGLSLHLAPRFFGLAEVTKRWARAQAWLCIGGVVLVVLGRLGALLPGSTWLGPLGACLLWVGVTRWVGLLLEAHLAGNVSDRLGEFLLAGATWWWLASSLLVAWSFGRLVDGPLAHLPLEPVYACGLIGGTGSWVFGVMLRAGICTLRLERPSLFRQRVMLLGWQVAAVGALFTSPIAFFATGAGVVTTLVALRAWSGALSSLPQEPHNRRVVQAGLVFLVVFAMLSVWRATGIAQPALIADAARHAYTLGFATLTVFGFGGRMVPGFAGATLAWPRLYSMGALFTVAGAALRLVELATSRRLLALGGTSGALAALGVCAMTACLLVTLAPKPSKETKEGTASPEQSALLTRS